jgi:hypothetical protein
MWRHSLKNWEDVGVDCYRFAFEQGEKRLKDVLADSEKITSRAYVLVGIAIPLFSTSFSVFVKQALSGNIFKLQTLFAIAPCVVLIFVLYQLLGLLGIRNNWLNGTEPKSMVQSEFMEREDFVFDEPIKALMLGEIEIIQQKIDENSLVNSSRMIVYLRCLKAIVLMAVVTFVGFLLAFIS